QQSAYSDVQLLHRSLPRHWHRSCHSSRKVSQTAAPSTEHHDPACSVHEPNSERCCRPPCQSGRVQACRNNPASVTDAIVCVVVPSPLCLRHEPETPALPNQLPHVL